jgi:hypothetical protein
MLALLSRDGLVGDVGNYPWASAADSWRLTVASTEWVIHHGMSVSTKARGAEPCAAMALVQATKQRTTIEPNGSVTASIDSPSVRNAVVGRSQGGD